MSGSWKSENQDAFLLQALGARGAAAPPLLLGVFDGHGVGGREASHVAAEGIAAQLAAQLDSSSCSSSSSEGGSSGGAGAGGAPLLQQALVAAFQSVAARMQADAAFQEGGSAAVVCLVERGRWALAAHQPVPLASMLAAARGTYTLAVPSLCPPPLLLRSISCAWAGDCRAVVGLSLPARGGRTCVVRAVTQDHKPGR